MAGDEQDPARLLRAAYKSHFDEHFNAAGEFYLQVAIAANPDTEEFQRSQWEGFKNEMWNLVREALDEGAFDVAGQSPRTRLLDDAVEQIARSVIQYPSTQYTSSNVESLAGMMNALEVSKRIDREDVRNDGD
jgi:hypothetical protein